MSVREDLVFAVRDALFDVSELGIAPFSVPAVAEVELVAEKLRTLVQRAQPRDLFDLRLYLVESGWHLDPADLRRAVDAKLALTRHRRWRSGLWRLNLEAIERPGTRRWSRGWIRHGCRRSRTRPRTSPDACVSFASTERILGSARRRTV